MTYSDLTLEQKEGYHKYRNDPQTVYLETLFDERFQKGLINVFLEFKATEKERIVALFEQMEALRLKKATELEDRLDASDLVQPTQEEVEIEVTIPLLDDKLYNIDEARRMLKVTRATLNNWRRDDLLIGNKLGKNRYYTGAEIREAMGRHNLGK